MCQDNKTHIKHMAEASRISREKMHDDVGGPLGLSLLKMVILWVLVLIK